jgi:lysozyme family protein
MSYDQAFAIVIGEEGGVTDDANDPGGLTKYGISQAAYPSLDIRNLTLDDAKAIYKRDYWDRVRAGELVPPLALLAFDAAVNNGVRRAIQWLQVAVGAKADGVFGPATMALVEAFATKHGGAALCSEYLAQRLRFMSGLSTWPIFGLGWSRRLMALPFNAMRMT